MTMIKAIDRENWDNFLADFTERNRGRKARFEIFSRGDFSEEEQEARFESAGADGKTVTISRSYTNRGEPATMTDTLENIRGIAVQYDVDNSEDMLEFTNDKNELTTLHFQSMVDGDS
jgi:hypothetical protein